MVGRLLANESRINFQLQEMKSYMAVTNIRNCEYYLRKYSLPIVEYHGGQSLWRGLLIMLETSDSQEDNVGLINFYKSGVHLIYLAP